MEKTKEQMYEKRNEVLENILAELKNEYEGNDGFSCVISVNDGTGTATMCYGSAMDLVNNVKSIENNDMFAKVKKLKQTLDEILEIPNN